MKAFDIKQIRSEAEETPMHSPMALDLAIAIIDDCFRDAGLAPAGHERWAAWHRESGKLWMEQVGMLGHLLSATSMGRATVAALAKRAGDSRFERLTQLFEEIDPLTGEMIRANQFRQEEAIRRWALTVCAGRIAGETARQAAARTEQLDYRKTLDEFRKAETARRAEATRRRKLLAAARKREAEARAWRE